MRGIFPNGNRFTVLGLAKSCRQWFPSFLLVVPSRSASTVRVYANLRRSAIFPAGVAFAGSASVLTHPFVKDGMKTEHSLLSRRPWSFPGCNAASNPKAYVIKECLWKYEILTLCPGPARGVPHGTHCIGRHNRAFQPLVGKGYGNQRLLVWLLPHCPPWGCSPTAFR